jgi:hypothetical protein
MEEEKDKIKVSYDIPDDYENVIDVAIDMIKEMPREALEDLSVPTLVNQLKTDKELYRRYWLKYKGQKNE